MRFVFETDPGENLREILVHLVRSDVSKEKKLAYYNAFVRLRYRFGSSVDQHLTKEEILVWYDYLFIDFVSLCSIII